VIDVIAPDGTNLKVEDAIKLKDLKISSTAIREYIVAKSKEEQHGFTPRGPRQPTVSQQSGGSSGGGSKK